MEVVIDQKGEETVIKIKGRLDTKTARECEEKVLPVWENPGVKVCVDCSDLEYVSSAGLRLFLILQKMTTAKKGSLRLIGMRNVVRETFSLTEFMLKAHLSAKNQINEVTREREVNDILPLINHIIRYTGILYTPKESDDTFTLDILNGGKWDSPIDKDLKD